MDNYRVLVIEDDPGVARLIQLELSRNGHTVSLAQNGEQGLQKSAAENFDVVLVDYQMPDLTGIAVLQKLAERGGFPPTIMITGHGNEMLAVEAIRKGAADYLVKDTGMKYLEMLPGIIKQVTSGHTVGWERAQLLSGTAIGNEDRYQALVEASPEGLAVLSSGKIEYVNPAGATLLGGKVGHLCGRGFADLIVPGDRERFVEFVQQFAGVPAVPWVTVQISPPGSTRILEIEIAGTPFSFRGEGGAVLLVFRDVTDRRLVQEQLFFLAHHDALTGLPNRTLFRDRLSQQILLSARHKRMFAVLFVDLDYFKAVNDSFGHEVGDELLSMVAEALIGAVRTSDTVARMGGDEFTIILSEIQAPENAFFVARKILTALHRPFDVQGNLCHIGASIGISLFPLDGCDSITLLKQADLAMYEAKALGRGQACFLTPPNGLPRCTPSPAAISGQHCNA